MYYTTKNLKTILTLTILFTTTQNSALQTTQATQQPPPLPTQQELHHLIQQQNPTIQRLIHLFQTLSIGIYLTYSRSGQGDTSRFYLPLLLRKFKPNGFFYHADIKYDGKTAYTVCIKLSDNGLELTIHQVGPHKLSITGIGYTFSLPPDWIHGSILAFSVMKPRINQ